MADLRFMALAERIGDAQMGRTADNPAVGCVIVKDDVVIGRGATADGGRPHAEVIALTQAGDAAHGAIAYVTLEPCAHHGTTPPCSQALIDAGISKVVCAWRDPFAKVNGAGFESLRRAGVAVEIRPRKLPDGLRAFFTAQILGRPFVALKLATSFDGKLALANGQSQWISGAVARRYTRSLRSRFHGIAVGVNTVIDDDPKLNSRMPGLRDPRPIVFDTDGRGSTEATVYQSGRAILVSQSKNAYSNVERLDCNPHDLGETLPELLRAGVQSMLLEGGAQLAASFLRAGAVDRIYHITTGALMGGDAQSALGKLGFSNMETIPRGNLKTRVTLGEDTALVYEFDHLERALARR